MVAPQSSNSMLSLSGWSKRSCIFWCTNLYIVHIIPESTKHNFPFEEEADEEAEVEADEVEADEEEADEKAEAEVDEEAEAEVDEEEEAEVEADEEEAEEFLCRYRTSFCNWNFVNKTGNILGGKGFHR